jgi:hypothetical protein
MPLTVRYDTLPMTPVRNRAWLEVACDGYEQEAATVAQVDLQLTGQPSEGYALSITLPDGNVTVLTAVAGMPDDSGEQYSIGPTLADTFSSLLLTLNSNPYMVLLYTMEDVGSETVRITARAAGANPPGITFPAPTFFDVAIVTEGADALLAPAYTANCRIYLERNWHSNVFEALPAVEQYPDENGLARWDLARMLKPYLERDIAEDWPAYGVTTPYVATHIFRRYYVDRWERYGDPPIDRKSLRSGVKYAWYAGTRNRDAHLANELGAIFRYDNAPTPFLTYRDRGGSHHEVSADQQHVLAWYRTYARVAGQVVKLKGTVFYDDGTSDNAVVQAWDDAAHKLGTVSVWPAGFKTLGLHLLQEAKVPYKYQLELLNASDEPVANKHTYWLKPTEVSELHLECINSLGAVESFRAVGRWMEALEPEREDLATLRTVVDGELPSHEESDASQQLIGVTPMLEVTMGHVDRLEHFARMDILYSPQLRLVDHATQRKLPVRLVPGSVQVRERGAGTAEHLYGMTLQLVAGDAEMAWGDRSLMPAFTPGVPGIPQTV